MTVWTSPGLAQFGRSWAKALGVKHIVGKRIKSADVLIAVGWHKPGYCDERTRAAQKRVIVWCGNDARRFSSPETLRESDIHLTANEELIPLLAKHSIEAHLCLFPTTLHPRPVPLPEIPHVIMYGGNKPEMYGSGVFHELQRRIPEARFTIWTYGQHTDAELTALIESSTCIVQAGALHGGIVVREVAEAGRTAISTYSLPYIECVRPDDTDACERIVREAMTRVSPDIAMASHWAYVNSDEAFRARVAAFL